MCCIALGLVPAPAAGQAVAAAPGIDLNEQVRAFSTEAAAALARQARVDIQIGALDPRLRLAPCQRIEPYLPAGQRLWGRTRVGLRCLQGPTRWNVYLPVTVRVYAQAVAAAAPLAPGQVIEAADLKLAEVDVTAGTSHRDPALVVGRQVRTAIAAGQPVLAEALHERRWFDAGDTVALVAVGAGYSVSSEGQALSPGLEGKSVRIRTENGRIVTAVPVAPRRAEIRL